MFIILFIAVLLIWLFWNYSFMINFRGRISDLFKHIQNLSEGKKSILTDNSVVVLTQEHCLDIIKLHNERANEFYSWDLTKIKTVLARKAWLQGYIDHCLEKGDYNPILHYIKFSYGYNSQVRISLTFNWNVNFYKIGNNNKLLGFGNCQVNYKGLNIYPEKQDTYKKDIENSLGIIGAVLEREIIILKNRHDEL